MCLWNYLSLDIKALMRFCFDLFDQDLSGYLDISEMHELLREVYGDSFETNDRLGHLMEELDANGDGRLSFEEFKAINQSYPSMLFPAFRIQQLMRDRVLGTLFWNDALKNRIKMGAGASATIWEITAAVDGARKMQSDDELGAFRSQRWRNPLDGPKGYHAGPILSTRAQKDADLARDELLRHAQTEWDQFTEGRAKGMRYRDAARAAGQSQALEAFEGTAAPDEAARVPAAATAVANARVRTTRPLAASGLGRPEPENEEPTKLQKRLQRVLAFDS